MPNNKELNKKILLFDMDLIAFRSAAAVEKRSITALHKATNKSKVFNTRTELKDFLKEMGLFFEGSEDDLFLNNGNDMECVKIEEGPLFTFPFKVTFAGCEDQDGFCYNLAMLYYFYELNPYIQEELDV